MKVLYDHQIFAVQKFGGIRRYYEELMKFDNAAIQIDTIDETLFPVVPYESFTIPARAIKLVKKKIGIPLQKDTVQFPEKVKNIFEKSDFDIFHPTYYDPYFLQYLNKPFVFTVYDMIHEVFKEHYDLADKASHNKRILCGKAKKIIAISENTKKDLIEIFKIPAEKIHVTLLASDFDKLVPSAPSDANISGRYILFTGSRISYKNFYYAAMALADVIRADKDLHLLCTGSPFTPGELVFFDDLGIGDKVKHIYLDSDQELAWAYRNAALFIFPSLYEGFGFPSLEAFASDCPVISSTGGSLKEVGGDAALYFNPKNITEIQSAAHDVLYNTNTRHSLIEKGRSRIKEYSWDICRAKTIDVYKDVIKN